MLSGNTYMVRAAAVMAMVSAASGGGLGPAASARSLARGRGPSRGWGRLRRGAVCDQRFRVGAWGGDGSRSVVTRQRERQAMRAEAKRLRREDGA